MANINRYRGYPAGEPTLDLDFVNDWPGALVKIAKYGSYDRDSILNSYFDINGVMQKASVQDVPRRDYHPVTHLPRGFLCESAATNLCLRSEAFDNATWTKVDTTITADSAVAPDGTTTADLCTEGSGGSALITQGSMTVTAGSVVSGSVFVKAGNSVWIVIVVGTNIASSGFRCWFNTVTGAVGTSEVIGTGTLHSVKAETLLNGWFRFSLTGIIDAVTTAASVFVVSASADGSTVRVNGQTRYQWGAQFQTTRLTNYVGPTAGVTEGVFEDDMRLTKLTDWFYATEGTLVVDYEKGAQINSSVVGTLMIASIDDGTTNNRIQFREIAGDQDFLIVTGAAVQGNMTVGVPVAETVYKLAGAYKADDFGACANGGTVSTDASGTIPTVSQLGIGCGTGGVFQVNGWIRRIRYYPKRRINSRLQILSAP